MRLRRRKTKSRTPICTSRVGRTLGLKLRAQDFVTADDNVATYGLRSIEELVEEAKGTESDSDGEDADVCDVLPSTSENHHALDVLRHTVSAGSAKQARGAKYGTLDETLLTWFRQARAAGINFDGSILRKKAMEVADRLGITDFAASNGWIDRFRKRHGIAYKTHCFARCGFRTNGELDEADEPEAASCEQELTEAMNALGATGVTYDNVVSVDAALVTSECQSITEIVADSVASEAGDSGDNEEPQESGELADPSFAEAVAALDLLRRYVAPQSDAESNGAFHVIEKRVVLSSEPDYAADLKVPLGKAVFFANGAWRDVKSETILPCFEKAGFSRGSSTAEEITAEADIDAAAADGAAAVTSLGQLWEAAAMQALSQTGWIIWTLPWRIRTSSQRRSSPPMNPPLVSPKRKRPQIAVPRTAKVTTLVCLSLGPPEQFSQLSTRGVCTCAPNRAVAICWTTFSTVF
ncbi:hypothetical protein MTO96_042915 [Rhipicephalus appendiculatus]